MADSLHKKHAADVGQLMIAAELDGAELDARTLRLLEAYGVGELTEQEFLAAIVSQGEAR